MKDPNGSDGGFSITGRARAVADPETREVAAKGSPYTPADRYVLFEFLVEECFVNHYRRFAQLFALDRVGREEMREIFPLSLSHLPFCPRSAIGFQGFLV